MSDTPWITARASSDGGQCVQMRRSGEAVEVRDSKNPTGPVLRFTRDAWAACLTGARAGEFDHLHR